jgi:hypothetical protein
VIMAWVHTSEHGRILRTIEDRMPEVGYRVAWDVMLENDQLYPDDPSAFVRVKAMEASARRAAS